MNWLQNYRDSALMVAITLLLPLLLVLYIMGSLWMARQDYQAEIDRLAPRISRLRGLLESEEQLQTSARQIGGQVLNMVYPGTDDPATVSAALQTKVREIMTAAGLTVSVSRVLPVTAGDDFDRIGLSITVTGTLDALDGALQGIAAYSPLLLIVSVDIKPVPARRAKGAVAKQSVLASLQFLTLRARQ